MDCRLQHSSECSIMVSEGTENDQIAYPKFHLYKITASEMTTVEYIFHFLIPPGLNQV